MKLTKAQYLALVDLSEWDHASAWSLGISITTMESLSNKGFVEPAADKQDLTCKSRMSPWRITPAGRDALAREGEE